MSRIPGVALSRNDFGEGDGVAVRGNGPDLTRVELDGVGIQSTSGLLVNADNARSADLRELPAELVKSVDVVKGATADMTEGSLGGTVQIKTRSGLDFKKPYFSIRAGVNRNSLGRKWQPDFNMVTSRKFLDDTIGVILSGTYSNIQNNSHGYEMVTSGNRHYNRLYDFDNSPEKTFTFNPATVGTDAANRVINANTTETPLSLVTKAASAKTKADCFVLFPHNPTGSNAQRTQRINEQRTCLNQWNDYTPSLIRNFMNEQTDQRYSIDGRVDFRMSDTLTTYVKGTYNGRKIHDQNRSRNPISLLSANTGGTFVDSAGPAYPRIRSLSPTAPAGYYLYDPQYGLNAVSNNATLGNVLNVVPSSIVVDDKHNVTQMTLTNSSVTIDQIENRQKSTSVFLQTGAEFRKDRLMIEAMAGMTRSDASKADLRTSRTSSYGEAKLVLQDNSLWDVQLPATYDDSIPESYVQLRPATCLSGGTNPATCIGRNPVVGTVDTPANPNSYTVAQLPLTSASMAVDYSPFISETSERIGKLDLTYDTDGLLPFVTRVKLGAQYRKVNIQRWGGGGLVVKDAVGTFGQDGYQAPIVVPTSTIRGDLRACEPTATSTVSCNYGFVPSTALSDRRMGLDTLTRQQLVDLIARTMEPASGANYFEGLPNRGNLPSAWNGLRTDVLFSTLGASQFMNFDCMKFCMASDGKVYEVPATLTDETVKNVYGMFDFKQQLPWGLSFDGNIGVRGVFTTRVGRGQMVLRSIRTTNVFNPADPSLAAGISTRTFRQNVSLTASTTDWLPTANFNLWAFDEKIVLRAYGGKTVAQPNIGRLLPAGTCVIDARVLLDGDSDDVYGCEGRIGNPALSPFTAWNYNLSLEWYANADTVISAAFGRLDVKIGSPISVTETLRPFAGSTTVDPVTGESLADFEFSVPTYANGPGYKRNVLEFQAKTAFTFLPWFLKHTGADVNYSKLMSSTSAGVRDPNTGAFMAPPNESRSYWNASLWYDDGKLNLRLAYQKRSETFNCITPCNGNNVSQNYPGEGYNNVALPYNPGVPRFTEGTTFIDAKASYNINRSIQIYLEGRNLTRESSTVSTGDYERFANGSARVMRLAYGGRRVMSGVRVQFGN